MTPVMTFRYGLVAYLLFFVTILYAIGFVTGLVVPKTIDSGEAGSVPVGVMINLLLLSLFAIQHSVMARKPFKAWVTEYIPLAIERSTFVLVSSAALLLLFWQWRPIPAVVWQITDPAWAAAVTAISLGGWVLVFFSTFLINHFELFGLQQVIEHLAGRTPRAPTFRTPVLYKLVRHPLYLGFIIAFWAAPTMTAGHLLFAAVTTGYIFLGIALEERDLVAQFGDDYQRHRRQVAMLLPFWRQGEVVTVATTPALIEDRKASIEDRKAA
jgi:methanethiol S-methyltransferase